MVFEFKIKGVSKRDVLKICKKYRKLFKRKSSSSDIIEAVCELFLEIVFVYFDNDQEKLYKLFFPLVMANLIEKGSIHSVIEEFRKSKGLFSWSYS